MLSAAILTGALIDLLPAVTDKHMLCVNFTWLGTNIFQLQLELYSSALGEVSQIPFFVYFCMLIDPTFMKVRFDCIRWI